MIAEGILSTAEGMTASAKPSGNRRNKRAPAAPPVETIEVTDASSAADKAAAAAAAKARDNAVTARLTKTKMCHFFERGKCASNDCRYAHSQSELRQQPNLEKTKLCRTFASDGYCNAGENCGFAHGEGELRVTDGIYKTQMCHFFERGRCLKGDRCNHAHGKEDLRQPQRKGHGGHQKGAPPTGFNGENLIFNGENAGGNAAPAVTTAVGNLGPVGLRSPLSPLPLAELLGDPAANIANTPAPALPVGLNSPDLFTGMGLWTGMPWTPPAFAPLGPSLGNGLGGFPMAQALTDADPIAHPATPVGGNAGYSMGLGAIPSTAPPPGMGSALGGGLGLGLSPAPGLAPATVGIAEGVRGGLEFQARQADKTGIVCDLDKRLASLDLVCNNLVSDVRDFTASGGQALADRPATAATGDATRERLVHRI